MIDAIVEERIESKQLREAVVKAESKARERSWAFSRRADQRRGSSIYNTVCYDGEQTEIVAPQFVS